MSTGERRAVMLLIRWRKLIDQATAAGPIGPDSAELAKLLPAFVELADDTDRCLDDATDGAEAHA